MEGSWFWSWEAGLWVFPRGFGLLPWWFSACVVWVLAGGRGRVWVTLASSLGLAWLGGRPAWGAGAIISVALLHGILPRLPRAVGAFFLLLLVFLGVGVGHSPVLLVSLPREAVLEGRLSLHVAALFFLFRALSYGVAVLFRGERPGFAESAEYFLAPPFWLEPGKGVQLSFATFSPEGASLRERAWGLWWVVRGGVHALLFAALSPRVFGLLSERFSGAASGGFRWWLEAGVLVFLLGYWEKSRMSYLLAGLLRLGGRRLEPDFRSPLLAKSLLEYWRRFHYWALEFYLEVLYQPLVYFLRVRGAVAIGLFLSFAVGTSVSHWIHYPAEAPVTVVFGVLFAAATLLHFAVIRLVRRWPWLWRFSWLGVPLTWATVGFLYVLAYPAFGLRWSA
ncbi:MAG: hypothetical protein HUU37_10905, partial [Bdellovibrionales bacterium]|nr:hypothetical protein [Bdellovibrionales bacterium]